ncbi:hypothetical protein B0H17DRAFT_545643 [Mycena rosella]|uniref:Uncharacterized protein n=1 Tax=Mycena rosella TaxID=1033263 RepID=A0AAD7FKQ2_MYCRO|nr:hypothetical protein B0H17DRAFT_545643 [Mycena rosella]
MDQGPVLPQELFDLVVTTCTMTWRLCSSALLFLRVSCTLAAYTSSRISSLAPSTKSIPSMSCTKFLPNHPFSPPGFGRSTSGTTLCAAELVRKAPAANAWRRALVADPPIAAGRGRLCPLGQYLRRPAHRVVPYGRPADAHLSRAHGPLRPPLHAAGELPRAQVRDARVGYIRRAR